MKFIKLILLLLIILSILFNQIKGFDENGGGLIVDSGNSGSSGGGISVGSVGSGGSSTSNEFEECNDTIGCGRNASRLILSFLVIIFLSMLIIYSLVRINIHYLPESLVVVVYGIIIGVIIKYIKDDTLTHLSTFNSNNFFLFILPFIIYETGFSLNKYEFFKNIKVILVLATFGTFIAFMCTGFGLYFLGKYGVSPDLSIFDSLLLSSITAATDPVATLGIFKALDVDPCLYIIVLGESILNDAVSVIFYDAVLSYSISEIWKPILLFFGVSIGSIIIGILVALVLALLLKYIDFGSFPALETIFIVLFSYSSYLIADSIFLSGILSSFFCGIASSQYVYKSLSVETKRSVSQLFRMIAFVGETIVFIYIGLALPNFKFNFNIKLIVWTFLLLIISRGISVFPTIYLINRFSGRGKGCSDGKITSFNDGDSIENENNDNNNNNNNNNKISLAIQISIWVSGLRGAISFSLMEEFEIDKASPKNASLLKTDILLTVYTTLFIFGSLTYPLLKLLKIKTNASDQTLESINKHINFQNSKFHFIGKHFIKIDNVLVGFFSRDNPPPLPSHKPINSNIQLKKKRQHQQEHQHQKQIISFKNQITHSTDDNDYSNNNNNIGNNNDDELFFEMDVDDDDYYNNNYNNNNNNNDDENNVDDLQNNTDYDDDQGITLPNIDQNNSVSVSGNDSTPLIKSLDLENHK